MVLLFFSFIAGALTAFAPCVLPLLPIIVGGTLSGAPTKKSRPYIITLSLAASLLLFTLLLKASSILINVPPFVWLYLSGGIIVALGILAVFPGVWENFVTLIGFQAKSQVLLAKSSKQHGWIGLVLTGAALGPVFSSCSPTYAFVLATVLPRNFAQGLIYLVVYSIGLVIVLLLISLLGQRFISRFTWAADPHGAFRRILGVLFVVVGISIITGWDITAEMWLASHSPIDLTKIEQNFLQSQKPTSQTPPTSNAENQKLFNVEPVKAPEFVGLSTWINSKPLTLAGLKGKVVLVDFWTYSCINCVRTLPYIEKWYETYKNDGFVVIGMHAPEFSFEKVESNVRAAVAQRGLTYPVALDNDLATWNAFNNQYWPAHYLIDKDGIIRNAHFGEGDYDITERAIQTLLGMKGPLSTTSVQQTQHSDMTPETYFGTDRAQNYVGSPQLANVTATFTPDSNLAPNSWTLGGAWKIEPDKITSQSDSSTIKIHVRSKDVYLVASVASGISGAAHVTLGSGSTFGKDDPSGNLLINHSDIYHIASFGNFQDAIIEIKVPNGVSLHTFTFGE